MVTGIVNERFSAEQKVMLAEIEKSEGGNNSSLGDNGETLLIGFLNRYLPPQFRAYKGHYRKISGHLSREIDVMILDSRFPILNETSNGVVHAMQHALLATVEVKRTLGKEQILTIRKDIATLVADRAEKPELTMDDGDLWTEPSTMVFSFRSEATLKTLARHFFQEPVAWCDMFIVEHGFECGGEPKDMGAMIRVEGEEDRYEGMVCRVRTPLSDFYYMLVEHAFAVLAARDLSDHAMRDVISSYYSWSTAPGSFETFGFRVA